MTAIVIRQKAAFAMVVKATKRVKAWKTFLLALPGVMTRARGRGVSGNVATPLPRTFARGLQPGSEEEGEGAEEISAGIAKSNNSRKGKGRKRKRFNSVVENVCSGLVTTSKSRRGIVRTPDVRMRDQ